MSVEMKHYTANELVCSNAILKVGCAKSYERLPKVIPIEEISHKSYLGLSEYTSPDDIESSLQIDPDRDLQVGG